MNNTMIFKVNHLPPEEAKHTILTRHLSYFGDEDGFLGLLKLIGRENPFRNYLLGLARTMDKRQPVHLWSHMEDDFKDLITKMTNLDPAKRIKAREALKHPWFTQETPNPDLCQPLLPEMKTRSCIDSLRRL
jgi:serine/threonine protein kinase